MKTQDVQRGIVSRRKTSERNGPDIGQLDRLRGIDYPGSVRRVRRRGRGRFRNSNNPARRKAALFWSILFGGGTIAVIGAVISLWLMPRVVPNTNVVAEAQVVPEAKVRVESRFPSPTRDQAIDLVTRAIENRNPEMVESLFRASSTGRSEIVDYFKNLVERDGLVERYDWLSSMDVNGLLVEGVLVVFKGKDRPCERLALLTPDSAGHWKMDFDAFARSAKPSWDKLLGKSSVDRAVVRVLVAHDVYYNGPFIDEKQWICYGIASPDTEQVLRGYCRVGSPQAAAMDKLFADGAAASRATLEIRRVKDSEPLQFEITQLMGQDWILPDPAVVKN